MQSELVLPAPPALSEEATEEELLEVQNLRIVDVLVRSSVRKALAGVNLVVSLLLVVAGVSLLRRRPTAIWWTVQASIANGLFAMADTAAQAHVLSTHWAEIVAGVPPGMHAGTVTLVVQQLGLALVLRAAVYGYVWFRVRRPDIRRFLAQHAREEGSL
jgi:hypothetical protein